MGDVVALLGRGNRLSHSFFVCRNGLRHDAQCGAIMLDVKSRGYQKVGKVTCLSSFNRRHCPSIKSFDQDMQPQLTNNYMSHDDLYPICTPTLHYCQRLVNTLGFDMIFIASLYACQLFTPRMLACAMSRVCSATLPRCSISNVGAANLKLLTYAMAEE